MKKKIVAKFERKLQTAASLYNKVIFIINTRLQKIHKFNYGTNFRFLKFDIM